VTNKEIKNLKTFEYYSYRVNDLIDYMTKDAEEALKDIGERITEFDRDVKKHEKVMKGLLKYWRFYQYSSGPA